MLLVAVLAGCGGPSVSTLGAGGTAAGQAQPAGVLPDASMTPGRVISTDRAVVCASGYSRSLRPPRSFTDGLKRSQLLARYPGTTGLRASDVEEDHVVMLALGGDPRSRENLWPEPRTVRAADGGPGGADAKNGLESYLYEQVCLRRRLALAVAQRELATNWYATWVAAGRPSAASPRD